MQKVIDIAAKWDDENGLSLSPEKTVAVLFNRKNKPACTDEITLTLNSRRIEFVPHVNYLGTTLDKNLNFKEHIKRKIAKAKKILFSLKSSIGKT